MKTKTVKIFTSIAMAVVVMLIGLACIFNTNVAFADEPAKTAIDDAIKTQLCAEIDLAYDSLDGEYTDVAKNRLTSTRDTAKTNVNASEYKEDAEVFVKNAKDAMNAVLVKSEYEVVKAEQLRDIKLYCASKGVDYKTFAETNKDKFEYDVKVTYAELYQVTETLMALADDTATASQSRWSTDKLVKIGLAINVITLLLVFMISRKKKEVPAKSQEGENKEEQKPAPVQKGDFFSYNANKTFVPAAITEDEPFAELNEEDAFANLKANNKTFEERLAEADDIIKQGYEEINAKLLSYKKVSVRVSKKYVSYRVGRDLVAKMTIRGKTLRCYLALDPETYEVTKLHHKDESEFSSYKEVPMMMRVRSNRAIKNTVRLVEDIATKYSLIAK